MPRGDGTGPAGRGAMTGRAAGFCTGADMPGYASGRQTRGFAVGYGRGRGAGFFNTGWRSRRFASAVPGRMGFGGSGLFGRQPDQDWEKQTLNNKVQALQSKLNAVKRRLAEMDD